MELRGPLSQPGHSPAACDSRRGVFQACGQPSADLFSFCSAQLLVHFAHSNTPRKTAKVLHLKIEAKRGMPGNARQ